MSRDTGPRLAAFSLIELLISLAIISMVLSLGLPAISGAKRRASASVCLDHLRSLSGASAAYLSDDSSNQLLPVHPIAETNELHDEGFFDYGGSHGAENIWSGDRWGPSSLRCASTRPLNRFLFGPDGASLDYSLFRCPSDVGLPARTYLGVGDYWDDAMSRQSLFTSVGTSYWGNSYRVIAASDDRPDRRFWSMGVFLRPAHRIPVAAQTVLYCEAIAWQQIGLTGNAGGGPTFRLLGGKGWHDGRLFNLSYCDGHAEATPMPAGTLAECTDLGNPVLASAQIRGSGFRFDCRPDDAIEDRPH